METSTLLAEALDAIEVRTRDHFEAEGAAILQLLGRYAALWRHDVDLEHRRREAAEIWEPDGTFADSMVGPIGPTELVEHINGVFLPAFAGWHLRPVGTPVMHARYVAFSWQLVDQGGARAQFPGSVGTDFVVLSERGRLQSVTGFFGLRLTFD
ncbi:hypothetical protein [Nocardioides ultimimeridianus]